MEVKPLEPNLIILVALTIIWALAWEDKSEEIIKLLITFIGVLVSNLFSYLRGVSDGKKIIYRKNKQQTK